MIEQTPSRILMTADTVGGVWTYALELVKALERFQTDVLLATMGAPLSSDQRRQVDRQGNLQLAESTYKLEWMADPWKDVDRAGEWLLELEREFEPELVHLNGYSHAALPWKAPVLVAAHSCVLSWWRAVKGDQAPLEWAGYQTRVRQGLLSADLVVAPSCNMMAAIEAHYGPVQRKRVIPNGRQIQNFFPGRKQEIILCAGRLWDEAKNVRAVCALAPELSWPVILAGECTDPDGRHVQLPNVRCMGRMSADQMPAWFAAAGIYAHPARYEPFGLSVLEAALSGCALVLGDIPSLRENWDGAAVFVSCDDPTQIQDGIQRLIREPAERAALAAEARNRALTFDIQITAELYARSYCSLINEQVGIEVACALPA